MRAKLLLLMHALVALLPLAGYVFELPDVRLYGTEERAAKPDWSLRAWMREETQTAYRKWFEEHLGFRGVLVRTDNTVLYGTLGETKPEAMTKIGRDDTLFIDQDLSYYGVRPRDLRPTSELDTLAQLVAEMQRAMEARGKHLIFVVSPAKTSLYPEAVPPAWRRRDHSIPSSDATVYGALRDALDRAGVRFADGRAVLSAKRDARELLVAKTGRHWTVLGACQTLLSVAREALPDLDCSYEIHDVDPQFHVDYDLFQLLNTWHWSMPQGKAPFLLLKEKTGPRPRALFVGTSFSWELASVLRPLVEQPYLFYYNRTIIDVHGEQGQPIAPIDTAREKWQPYVGDRDLIVIELLEAYAWGEYVRDFLTTLREQM